MRKLNIKNNTDIPVITIDGPSGSGKGTISGFIAKKLHWHFLDSGALYRILAWVALHEGIKVDDIVTLTQVAVNLDVSFNMNADSQEKIIYKNRDITDAIREEKCADIASQLAEIPEIRRALLERQRFFKQLPGLIADGRDMGTVVFPEALLKIYLTASVEERARRRYNQLQQKGINVSLAEILQDLLKRDARDKKRTVAPLKPAVDAVIIDTTKLSINEVLQEIIIHIEKCIVGMFFI